ncbi:MAG: GNAT family N-acetyltransferase [Prevotella sp.]|nr:GNAT family N-acetyltransferase [Prevotella sp.]
MFTIRRYTADDKVLWDNYVAKARNATFLFMRDYMDYHADRFHDHSLLFFKGRRLHSVLPAHEDEALFASHAGLTYGGLLMDVNVTTAEVVQLFDELCVYLRDHGFRRVLYKPVPWVYHRIPAEEDLYAMFWKCNARLLRRMSGTVIALDEHLPWRKDHRRRLKNALQTGVRVVADDALDRFWPVLEENLRMRFETKPVHTLQEMELLKSRFPSQILQYNAYVADEVVGGITFYLMGHVLHGQYSATSSLGKECGAMEAIYQKVIFDDFAHCRYLDFGTSNEQGGLVLNEGLIDHKEAYGGRTVCYDTYEWTL